MNTFDAPPSIEERIERGRAARAAVPRSSHADVDFGGRPDPVSLVASENADRLEWLVPVRHGRMSVSPFTFYRGAASIMAADLASTPSSGLTVQLAGDAHLSNFGSYAAPDRTLVFDQNDFDETLPGPWEWDLKRLATSFTIAGQDIELDPKACRRLARQVVASYRGAMQRFASERVLDVWYDRLDASRLEQAVGTLDEHLAQRVARYEAKARSKDSLQALRKLAVEVDGRYQIRHDPPTLLRMRDVPEMDPDRAIEIAYEVLERYGESLADDRRHLLDRFTPIDVGLKVVGVGSVGTRCFIVLLQGRDRSDPLFLQVKEAGPSALADHLPASRYHHQGRRVVAGQQLVQAASDIFLGWTNGPEGRHFYVRQLRDWKGSADVSAMEPGVLLRYAELCGWTLARGHARSGDAVAISAYCGRGDRLDRAIATFADVYAERNREDHAAMLAAIEDGRLPATFGV